MVPSIHPVGEEAIFETRETDRPAARDRRRLLPVDLRESHERQESAELVMNDVHHSQIAPGIAVPDEARDSFVFLAIQRANDYLPAASTVEQMRGRQDGRVRR